MKRKLAPIPPAPTTSKWRYFGIHLLVGQREYDEAIEDGRRFETWKGTPLNSFTDVRAARRRDGEVISR